MRVPVFSVVPGRGEDKENKMNRIYKLALNLQDKIREISDFKHKYQ